MSPRVRIRLKRASAALAMLALAAGCNDFLKASNPSAIQVDDLNNPLYIPLMVNGVIGEFQAVVDDVDLRSGIFADELFSNHGFAEEREIDKRNIDLGNGTYPLVLYVPMQRSRYLADSVASRLKVFYADSASRNINVARVLAYAGYSYELLAENLCTIPVNGSVPYSPEELTKTFTIPRLNEAISVATAARLATSSTAAQATADSIINFARVGIARAALYVNDKATARAMAAQVPAAFEFRAYYSANNIREYNAFADATTPAPVGSPWVSLEPSYKRLNDPRVPTETLPRGVQSLGQGNADTVTIGGVRTIGAYVPNAGIMSGSYNGTVQGARWARDSYIKIATGLEAQYIVAEADGPTPATLAFINSRRTVGGQGNYTGTDIMGELREQRRRDLFNDGHRLGDLRRYLKYQTLDLFPRGAYPGSTTGETYNNATCWPLPLAELAGNPNATQ
jgi:starch-binding outer membrane protein, SusD/RagB family